MNEHKLLKICFAGNMIGRNAGFVTTQGLIVSDLLKAENHEIICVSSKLNRAARLAEIAQTLIQNRKRIDAVVLEVYSGLSFIIAETVSLICSFCKLPLVMVLHGGKLPEFIEKQPFRTKTALRRADFLIAPSGFLADKFEKYGFKVRVIPNVINLENYPFRRRVEIAPNFIWMRSFHPVYNPQMAIKVFAEIKKDYPAATLTMAGVDKGLETETKRLAAALNLAGSIEFAGFLNEENKTRKLSEADIYLHTNRFDNMPVSVVEAAAFGLPIVATRVGGIPYLLKDGENALLVESEDVLAMSVKIKMLLENTSLVEKLSVNARRLAEQSDWQAVRNDWNELFGEIREMQDSPNQFGNSKNSLTVGA